MNMQGVSWKGKHYAFPYEQSTPSEPLPDYREVMICQMSDRIETLEEQISELKNTLHLVIQFRWNVRPFWQRTFVQLLDSS